MMILPESILNNHYFSNKFIITIIMCFRDIVHSVWTVLNAFNHIWICVFYLQFYIHRMTPLPLSQFIKHMDSTSRKTRVVVRSYCIFPLRCVKTEQTASSVRVVNLYLLKYGTALHTAFLKKEPKIWFKSTHIFSLFPQAGISVL